MLLTGFPQFWVTDAGVGQAFYVGTVGVIVCETEVLLCYFDGAYPEDMNYAMNIVRSHNGEGEGDRFEDEADVGLNLLIFPIS